MKNKTKYALAELLILLGLSGALLFLANNPLAAMSIWAGAFLSDSMTASALRK
jgi:hypothetical protein